MCVKTGINRSLLVAILSPTRESNDTHVAADYRAKAATNLIAVHVRQPNIEQNDLGFEFLCRKKTRSAIVGDPDQTPALLDEDSEYVGAIAVVIDHQKTHGFKHPAAVECGLVVDRRDARTRGVFENLCGIVWRSFGF